VIEHVPDAEMVLREIARVLRPDGLLIDSTSNKWPSSPLQRRPINPYHVVEWYPSGFKKLVSRCVEFEEVLGKSWYSVGMTWQALRSNARTRLKGILSCLRLLGVAQQLRKASGHDSVAEEASQQGSLHLDAATQEEVLAGSHPTWTNTRQEGIPLTVILVARWSKAHVSQRSGWESHQE
jgi:Methyltransferase domain